jgi:mycothiol system anti-sigma-R factor
MIKCEEVLKLLYDYIDKQLDSVPSHEIEEHLAKCRYCRRHHDFELALQQLVTKSCFAKKAPPVLSNKIKDLLREEPEQ